MYGEIRTKAWKPAMYGPHHNIDVALRIIYNHSYSASLTGSSISLSGAVVNAQCPTLSPPFLTSTFTTAHRTGNR